MTFQPGDIVMTLQGSIHWTFLEDRGDGSAVIRSQMTERRRVEWIRNLRYWKPGD